MDSSPTTLDGRIRREARVAGLARSRAPSLRDVDGRRLQLWGLASLVLVGLAAAVGLLAGPNPWASLMVPPSVMRLCTAGLALAFCAYTIEKEVHLHRLAALLLEEQLGGLALRAEIGMLLEAARVRSELAAAVGHDLRTPLTAIRAAADLLRAPLPLEDRRTLLDVVVGQSGRLESMIEQLLTAAILEREGPPLDLVAVDAAAIAREVAADRPATLVEAPGPALVRTSPDGLRRVLEDLLANAYRHGRPPVGLRVRADTATVEVTVTDAGGGIRPEDRRRVFDLFTRLEPSRTGPGMGLGLGIVQGLAGAWGGRVWVDDAPGGGAAFHVALPAYGASSPAGRARASRS
jgi:signal transduction histidine kinase